jgi:hypothetical protein
MDEKTNGRRIVRVIDQRVVTKCIPQNLDLPLAEPRKGLSQDICLLYGECHRVLRLQTRGHLTIVNQQA